MTENPNDLCLVCNRPRPAAHRGHFFEPSRSEYGTTWRQCSWPACLSQFWATGNTGRCDSHRGRDPPSTVLGVLAEADGVLKELMGYEDDRESYSYTGPKQVRALLERAREAYRAEKAKTGAPPKHSGRRR